MIRRNQPTKRNVSAIFLALLNAAFFLQSESSVAQQRIAHIQPDALGAGMSIAMEVLAPAKDSGAFGADGIYLPTSRIQFFNPADSADVVFGPLVVSWQGRVIQMPVMVRPGAATRQIRFRVATGNKLSEFAVFEIAPIGPKLSISGNATLGDGFAGTYSFKGRGNTIVCDEIEFFGQDFANRGFFDFSKVDTSSIAGGNPHYHPVTLLSRGPIHLRNAEFSVSADSLNGGPGGGGGGAGFAGSGGAGYTGGGSDSDYSVLNVGSGALPTFGIDGAGGASTTGVPGGASSFFDPNIDQGGGGGTGCPYGSSGIFTGGNGNSGAGGYGGGSAGGETLGLPYGGGGGGFATNGSTGAGNGNNGGLANGGRFLIPMQGGSGGGAGNHVSESDSTAGSGGGGGGALTIVSFDTLSINGSIFSSKGAKGTTGETLSDAGGGGGSGGGVLLSAKFGVVMKSATITTSGGIGGLGGTGTEQASKGGAGGLGRIRIDGDIRTIDSNNFFAGVQSSGPTINIPSARLIGKSVTIIGSAGDSTALTDTIRIYYRNHHSAWSYLDTLRFRSNGRFIWQATLPLGHDSSLFVSAMAQTKNPLKSPASADPLRILSHLSSGILRIQPTPHLVLSQDTIIFGCYKIGDSCVSANISVSNLGEDSLHIGAINIPGGNFSATPQQIDLGYYETKNIVVKYCPTKVGKDTTTMQFVSNEGVHVAVMIGCGIDKDTRISLKPTTLNFGKLHVGKCDTLEFTAKSIGKDSALLSPDNFVHPPFSIIQPQSAVLLGPKDSIHVKISFCPDDTGSFHASFILTEKRDSVVVSGIGTRLFRFLEADTNLTGKTLCVSDCDTIRLHLHSRGNDTVMVSGISSVTLVTSQLPIRIPGHTDTSFLVRYCAVQRGDNSILITYSSDADTIVAPTALNFQGSVIELKYDQAIKFGPLCLPASDSLPVSISNLGIQPISIAGIHLLNGNPFAIVGDTSAKQDSSRFFVRFTPQVSGIFHDTLIITAHSALCNDSIIRIPIDAVASASLVSFSSSSIQFGGVDSGLCKIDSVQVAASCPITIAIPPLSSPFSIISPSGNSLSLASGETRSIVYQYCPNSVSVDTLIQTFTSLPGGSFDLRLIGEGKPLVDSPYVRFRLSKTSATAGIDFLYLISVDSISTSANIHSLQASLKFDPTVIQPLDMNGISWNVTSKVETVPGVYDFVASGSSDLTTGPFATMKMLPLYGIRDTTSVFLNSIVPLSTALTSVIPGFITVTHCGDLPGNIIVAGDYGLGEPVPNPANGNISLPVVLGNDGMLRITLYTPSGMMAMTKSFDSKRGINTVVLDVSALSSGIYYLSADSWGWRDGKKLLIQK